MSVPGRALAFVVAGLVATYAVSAAESKPKAKNVKKTVSTAKQTAVDVAPLFKAAEAETKTTVQANGMTVVSAPQIEVVVARVEADGSVSTQCVSTEKGARAFMNSLDKVEHNSSKEQ